MALVVILGSAYPLRGGGLATFNERLARAFMDAGHEVIIYTFSLQYPSLLFPGKSQYAEDEPAPQGLDIRVKVNSINPFNWIRVGRELRRLKPDLLVIRYWLPLMAPSLGWIASVAGKKKTIPVVAIADNIIPHERRFGDRWLTRFFLKRVQSFVTMSDAVRKDLLSFGVEDHRIRLCLHPLYDNYGEVLPQDEARKVLGISKKDLVVLFFGFIRDYKGLDLLMKAIAHHRMNGLEVKVLVAGEFYSDKGGYIRLASDLGIGDRMIWRTNFIPNEEVRYYFCAADLVVQPYKSATQSGVTQVAYHFNKPMVVTNVGGLPEMVRDGKAGYVVEPNEEAIAGAIAYFFQNEQTKSLTDTLKQEKKRFSWEKLTSALWQLAQIK